MEILSKNFSHNNLNILIDFSNKEYIYLNATKTAKAFGKDLSNWRRSQQTVDYVKAILSSVNSTELTEQDLFVVVLGKGKDQGTWIHKKLIIYFAR